MGMRVWLMERMRGRDAESWVWWRYSLLNQFCLVGYSTIDGKIWMIAS